MMPGKVIRAISQPNITGFRLFPFYSGWRFAGDIVNNTVDTGYLVDYAAGYASQQVMWQSCPVGCHSVLAGHGANGDQVAVGAEVSHDAHASDIGEYSEALPQLTI